ncbi:MAG: DUF2617 family protein [Planctomycetaceae bacterium]|nr:DUF2617 family protein [Planctomycetaceae bacterium]
MAIGYARPDVADMVLRVFDRSVHPELFDSLRVIRIAVGPHWATLRLNTHGHVLEFRTDESVVTEVATSRHSPLPLQMKMIDRRLIGYRTHMIDSSGVRYHCSYQLEAVPPDIYLQLHREMELDARSATLSAILPGSSPCSPDCISMLRADVLREGLVVHAFHTFPDNGAVLRTQTLFELL